MDTTSYPRAREDREAALTVPQPEGIELPRVRLMTWIIRVGPGAVRSSASLNRCRGPAMLRDCSWYAQLAHLGQQGVFVEIGYSTSPVLENNVVTTLPRPYTKLVELINPFNLAQVGQGAGLVDASTPDTFIRWKEPLDLFVDVPEFYPVIAWYQIIGVPAQNYFGQLRVTEQIHRVAAQRFPLRRPVAGLVDTEDAGARYIALLTGTGPQLPMFDPPPALEAPHSWYWQRDTVPYDVLRGPTGQRGPEGYHYIDAGDAARYRKELANYGPAHYIADGIGAPDPLPGMTVSDFEALVRGSIIRPGVPRPPRELGRVRLLRRRPRSPRVARDPRIARVPRPPRVARYPRSFRAARPPRPPRPARPPRAPRRPTYGRRRRQTIRTVTKDYYCAFSTQTGENATFGGGIVVPRGSSPPSAAPGMFWVKRTWAGPCEDWRRQRCDGPGAGVLGLLANLLPSGWRAANDPRSDKAQYEKSKAIRRPLRGLPAPPPAANIAPPITRPGVPCCDRGFSGWVWCDGAGWLQC
jgi:hypothetical protein